MYILVQVHCKYLNFLQLWRVASGISRNQIQVCHQYPNAGPPLEYADGGESVLLPRVLGSRRCALPVAEHRVRGAPTLRGADSVGRTVGAGRAAGAREPAHPLLEDVGHTARRALKRPTAGLALLERGTRVDREPLRECTSPPLKE